MDRETIREKARKVAQSTRSNTLQIGKEFIKKGPHIAAALSAGALALTINTVVNPGQPQTNDSAPTQTIPTPIIDKSWEITPTTPTQIPQIDPIKAALPIPNFPTFEHGPNAFLGYAKIKGSEVAICLPDAGQPNRLINCEATLPTFTTQIPSDSEGRICRGIHTPLLPVSRINGSQPDTSLFEVLCQKGTNNINRVVRDAVLDTDGNVRILE